MSIDTSKIIHAPVGGGRYTVTAPIVKEDYGLYLKIEGLELPATYDVDFSNSEHSGTSVTMIGNADGVLIPSQFIKSGKDVFAFLYHVGADYGRTVYKFRIPNKLRPDRTDEEPTPEEQSVIDQAISALNDAVAQTAQDKADADVSAQNASADAERAEEARTDAQNYATQAEQSATDAHTSASQASASATASAQSAQSASQSAQDAQDALEEFTTPTASATTLPEGSNATASYSNGNFAFGIPRGDKGERGERGLQGIQGERGLQGETGQAGRDGTDGTDGISPTVTITPITGGHRITITDADGEHSADVMDGTGSVDDVQINGSSIVVDGVANVPIGSQTTLGVVKSDIWAGTEITRGGVLRLFRALQGDIKNGNEVFRPITPSYQHDSVFYGLAKAAGDTTQSQSSNEVGNYTEDAKRAIRKMLGLPRYTESELIADVTTSEELASLTINTDVNGLPFEIRKAKIIVELKASTTGNADYFTATANCLTVLNEESAFSFATLKMEFVNISVMMYEFDAGEGVSTNRGYVRREIGLSTSAICVMLSASQLKYLKAFTFKQYGSTTSLIPIGTRIRIFGIRY